MNYLYLNEMLSEPTFEGFGYFQNGGKIHKKFRFSQ